MPLTAFASDLGAGKFDGAWLVQNFENQNPANTLWSKQYNLYSKIDTEAPRYLGFERWWGGHVNLNAEEIQFIVDELFVGNNLAAGNIRTSDGTAIDLGNIRSPIVVFCSQGDNITPPQQALGWILDLYEDVDEIRAYGQTIVYTIHETIGHLGIFVSTGVARKNTASSQAISISSTRFLRASIGKIRAEGRSNRQSGSRYRRLDYAVRVRTLDDPRIGVNDMADDHSFATVDRVSRTNLALYRAFVQPIVRAFVNPALADFMRQLHPLRLQYEMFSNANPMTGPVAGWAQQVRDSRRHALDPTAGGGVGQVHLAEVQRRSRRRCGRRSGGLPLADPDDRGADRHRLALGHEQAPTTPAYGEGSSTSDLAVSISTTMSLIAMVSPTFTFQVTISASVRP